MRERKLLSVILILSIACTTTGCTSGKDILNGVATFFFVIDLIAAILLLIRMLGANNSRQRGTNAVTKFVRDVGSNAVYSSCQMWSILLTLVFCLLGLMMGGNFWAGIPTAVTLVLTFVFKNKSTKDQGRVKAARTVTKGSLEVTGAVAQTAGTVVGSVYGQPELGNAIGSTVNNVTSKAAGSMTDVQGIGVTAQDFQPVADAVQKQIAVADPTKFMAAAKRAGVASDGEDVQLVAQRVYSMIPEAAKPALADKSEGEQAMLFLEGKV